MIILCTNILEARRRVCVYAKKPKICRQSFSFSFHYRRTYTYYFNAIVGLMCFFLLYMCSFTLFGSSFANKKINCIFIYIHLSCCCCCFFCCWFERKNFYFPKNLFRGGVGKNDSTCVEYFCISFRRNCVLNCFDRSSNGPFLWSFWWSL